MPTQVERPSLRIRLLGSAAGGGYPQWNCCCKNCQLAWANKTTSETQFSVAFSLNHSDWYLINASPDIRQQILATDCLHPRPPRQSPIKGIWLTCADIDSTAGLFLLREQSPFTIYGTASVIASIKANPYYNAFNTSLVRCRSIQAGDHVPLEEGLSVKVITVPGKIPLYEETHESTAAPGVAFILEHAASGKYAVICPGTAAITESLHDICAGAELVLMDGTLWTNHELIDQALRDRSADEMAHIAMEGAQGSLAQLQDITAKKVYVHVNNSNPVWNPDGAARQQLLQNGWLLGKQGMEWYLC
jgi:pyrroloquinoline quinone biosynthesis protein B